MRISPTLMILLLFPRVYGMIPFAQYCNLKIGYPHR